MILNLVFDHKTWNIQLTCTCMTFLASTKSWVNVCSFGDDMYVRTLKLCLRSGLSCPFKILSLQSSSIILTFHSSCLCEGTGGYHGRLLSVMSLSPSALSGGFFLAWGLYGEDFWWINSHLCFLIFFIWSGDQLAHSNSTFYARIGLQWLSKLRWLWPSILWWVACKLMSLIGSHTDTMPWQNNQPTWTSLGQGCVCLGVYWQNDRDLLCATRVTQRME